MKKTTTVTGCKLTVTMVAIGRDSLVKLIVYQLVMITGILLNVLPLV